MILERLARGQRIEHDQTVRVTRDGRRVEVSITVLNPEGRITDASSIARDITPRQHAEGAVRERDALPYVASLAAAAAHEINNPLAVIVGQAQLLAATLDATGRRRIEEILEAARRIQGVVDRLKHINRLELVDAPQPVPAMLDLQKSGGEG